MTPTRESPQDAAERLLKLLWQKGAPHLPLPVDAVQIARDLGIDVFDAQMPGDVSGALIKEKGKDARILLNRDDSRNRQRFSCAHEVGHFVQRSDDEYDYVDYRDIFSSSGDRPEEVYANTFAACLLMPEAEVRKFHKAKMSEVEMAVRFDVSKDAMHFRLVNLRLAKGG